MNKIKLVEITVSDKYYSFNTWPTSKGLNILKRVARIVGPAMFAAMQEGKGMSVDVLKHAAQELVLGLDQEDLGSLCKSILEDVKVDNKTIPFDLYFAGEYKTLFKLVFQILKSNFSDLLEGTDAE